MTTELKEMTATQEPTPKDWLTAEPPLVLEEFFLTRLNLGFTAPNTDKDAVTQVRSSFDYEVGVHNEDTLKYRLIFRVKTQELTSDNVPLGRSAEIEIIGHFAFPKEINTDQKNFQIRVGGVSILYGLLRGIVSSATAQFPGGHFILPTIMPQKIVAMVEGDHKKAHDILATQTKDGAKDSAEATASTEP